jgi:DNA-binding transcriptional LysR family regulator
VLPDITTLQCFLEAARAKSFREAARAVSLTPAALGQRIAKLEGDLGVALFVRSTRQVALTLDGLRLVPLAQSAIDPARACVAGRGEAAPAVDLIVGTRQELGLSWLVPQLDALEAALPSARLNLYFGSGSDLLLRLRTREIDCAVSSHRTNDPKIDGLTLHREDYVFVGAPALLRKVPLRTLADTEKHVLLDATHDLPLLGYLRQALPGKEPRFARAVLLGSIEAIRARTLAAKGVAVLPLYFVKEKLAKKQLIRLLPRVTLAHDHFRLQFREGDPRRAIFEAMAETMRRCPLS